MSPLLIFEHLIPASWFSGLPWYTLILVVVAALVVLIKGADLLVESAGALAYRIGMPKVIVGATIVSVGTTSPEAAVSVMAAWGGKSGLALGNAVGSIVADTGLIFGAGCLLMRLPVDRFVVNRQGWVQFGAGVALAGFCYFAYFQDAAGAELGRFVGVSFLLALVAYMYVSVLWARQRATAETESESSSDEGQGVTAKPLALCALMAAGLALVLLASHVLIESVSELARQFGVPQVVIAATIVAFGTSLPELMVGITSIRRNHPDLLIGNVIGADVLNVFFVIGASAVAAPLPVVDPGASLPEIFLFVHLPTMLVILVLFRVFIASACRKGHFERWQGVPLVLLWVGYVIVQYALS